MAKTFRIAVGIGAVAALAGCGVVTGAASVVGSAVGTAIDVTGTVVETTADVVTKPFRD